MGRRLPLLSGLAILAVVCNHATGWGYTAMFWWAHRYRPVASPNFDQLGSPAYYGLVALQQLALFSVPVFLFISGFFMAYAAQGSGQGSIWKPVRIRILNLLWPYLVWSFAIFVGDGIQGHVYSPTQYVYELLTGGAITAYFYIPLLCQFYLLSPLIVRLAKNHPALLLVSAAAIQLAASSLFYLQFAGLRMPEAVLHSSWLFVWQAFYFPLGVVIGLRPRSLPQLFTRLRWALVALTVVLAVASIVEAEWTYRALAPQQFDIQAFDWTHSYVKVSSGLYAVAFILTFLAFDIKRGKLPAALNWVGARSYGLYLLHPELLVLLGRVFYHVAPWLLSQQLLLTAILIVLGAGIVLLVMEGIARSPLRNTYRYLFG